VSPYGCTPIVIQKIIMMYVELALANYLLATCTFDLWMHHIFFIVIKFLSSDLKMKHVTVSLFEVTNISEAIMFSKL
jgi:hypothetical protein